MAAGEQAGNLEIVLRQMADYLERGANIEKRIKNAMTYPAIVAIVAVLVVIVIVTFVLPSFIDLYSAFGVDLPLATRMLIGLSEWLVDYGLFLLLGFIVIILAFYAYFQTPTGKYQFHQILLTMPVLGRINLLGELSRCCRTISLLFRVGLPLPEILAQAVHGTKNKVMSKALSEVQQELIRGEGLSKPMGKRKLFLPLMVQMAGVGEETGNLDNTLATVAQTYEVEADDKINSAVALIQPAITIAIGLVVGFVAIALVSSMYSIYGTVEF
jgi:type IV pilus assembly protein PilC